MKHSKLAFFQYHNFLFEGYSYTAKSHPIILVLAKETMINAISKISDIEGLWCNISFLCMFGRLRRYNQLCFTVKKILEEASSGTICPLARGKWWEPNRLTSIACAQEVGTQWCIAYLISNIFKISQVEFRNNEAVKKVNSSHCE